MRKNNKAFTIVELLVTVVIFSLVFLAVTSFLIIGSRTFTKGNADANLQREAQLAINQIGDMIIDSTGGVEFIVETDYKELVLYNIMNGKKTKESVRWLKDKEVISYLKWEEDASGNMVLVEGDESNANPDVLTDKIIDFNADVSDTRDEYDEDGDIVKVVQSVKLSAEYEDSKGMTAYATTPAITLRNRMIIANGKMKNTKPDPDPRVILTCRVRTYKNEPGTNDVIVYLVGTTEEVGYGENEVTYKWTHDKGEQLKLLEGTVDTNPNECTFRIPYANKKDLNEHGPVTFTLTATDRDLRTFSASCAFPVNAPQDFTEYEHERGAEGQSRQPVNVTDGQKFNAFDYTISIQDDSGHKYLDKELEELLTHHIIFTKGLPTIVIKNKEGKDETVPNLNPRTGQPYNHGEIESTDYTQYVASFYPDVRNTLDKTKGFLIKIDMKIVGTAYAGKEWGTIKDYSREMYIPPAEINTLNPECKWGYNNEKNMFDLNFGDAHLGDGIRFIEHGFVREETSGNSNAEITNSMYYITDIDGDNLIGPKDPNIVVKGLEEGYKIRFVPSEIYKTDQKNETGDYLSNVIRTTFKLELLKENSNGTYSKVTQKKLLNKVDIESFDVKVSCKEEPYYNHKTGEFGACPMKDDDGNPCTGKLGIVQNSPSEMRLIKCDKCGYTRRIMDQIITINFKHPDKSTD